MFKAALTVIIAIFVVAIGTVSAQQIDQRTQSLVAALDKTKYKKKEKKGLSFELYVDVKNAPDLRSNPTEYSGIYDADLHRLELAVAANGTASGTGYDDLYNSLGTVKFALRDAKVEGALLTGIKVYENGETRKFEAVFVNRTITLGKNANDIDSSKKMSGLGYLEGGAVVAPGMGEMNSWTNRIFLERR